MTNPRLPDDDREEPPMVLGALIGAGAQVERAVRRVAGLLHIRVLLFIWGAGTIAIFLFVLSASVADLPGWQGVLRGLFGGAFIALLFAAAFGWFLLWARGSGSGRRDERSGGGSAELNTLLAPQLRELTAARADVIRQARARSRIRVPLGIAGALVFWILSQWNADPPGAFELLMFLAVGAIAGEVWAINKLQTQYERLYKSRVLPALAARVGDLTYKPASADKVQRLRAARILPECDSVDADDEIAGTHRGLGLSIIEARLRRRSGKETRTVFDGLLIEIVLPRSLTGTTAVLTDEGVFGNFKTSWKTEGLETVRLEDPEFERRFEVYSNDQIEARALLTPAFMERFTSLAKSSGFSLPGAMAEGNRLVVALPKAMGTGDLFEPPAYWKPAGGQALVALERDIRAVLSIADTVVNLDFWAAGRR